MTRAPRARGRQRQYWTFAAHPATYDIEHAVQTLKADLWPIRGKDVRVGDRVIVWKYKGGDAYRGIVALAEVTAQPAIETEAGNPFWVRTAEADVLEERVEIRYVVPPGVPLWLTTNPDDPLRSLSVSRAAGGSVFYVTAPQWEAVLAAVGGWPSPAPKSAARQTDPRTG